MIITVQKITPTVAIAKVFHLDINRKVTKTNCNSSIMSTIDIIINIIGIDIWSPELSLISDLQSDQTTNTVGVSERCCAICRVAEDMY